MAVYFNFKATLLFIAFIFVRHNAYPQDVHDDFKKINRAYEKHVSISQDITYKYFTDHKSVAAAETIMGYMKKQGGLFHARYGNTEVVKDSSLSLIIDTKNKFISVNQSTKIDYAMYQNFDLDSLITHCSEVKYDKEPSGTESSYTFYIKKSPVSGIRFVFQSTTHLISRLVVFYGPAAGEKSNGRLEIEYKNINVNPVFESSVFSIAKYLKKKNNKLQLTPAFQKYKLVTNNYKGHGKK